MQIDEYEHGVPSWVDFGSPNPQQAADFFSALFGWDCPPGPEEAGGYRVCTVAGRSVAGIYQGDNPGPPVWATYVNVDDAAAIAEAVTANGGQVVMPPMAVMDTGTMAVFTDPLGAFFGVWQPGVHRGAGIVNEPGTYSWSELLTTDVDAAIAFYSAVFGWGADTHGDGPMAYTEWQVGGRSVGGLMLKPPMLPAEVPPHWAVYFSVADTDDAVARVTELGGSVLVPPMDIEPGRFAVVTDPTGGIFSVIALKPELTR